jgi:uncharacterized membrane protein
VVELRGAIPVGALVYDLPLPAAAALAVLGNLLPVPVILYALEPVSDWMRRRSKLADAFFERMFERTRTKHTWRFERFRDFALVTLVAIPLPVTGAWTGSLCAFLFGVPPRRAFPRIAAGVVVAAVIVTVLVATGRGLFGVDVD